MIRPAEQARDRFLAVSIVAGGIVLAILVATGCTTQDQWMAAGSSLRLGAYAGHENADGSFSRTDKPIDTGTESHGFTMTWAPFEYWNQKQQAQAIARAITEAQYAAAMKEKECQTTPTSPK